jgi:hypothetical protein
MQFAESMFDQSSQLICGAVDGKVHRRRFVGDRDGLVAFEARLHHAALVILAPLRAAFVGHVDLHPRNVIAHSAQRTLYYAPDPGGQRLVAFDCMIRIDLDLHADLLPNCLIDDVFLRSYIAVGPLRATSSCASKAQVAKLEPLVLVEFSGCEVYGTRLPAGMCFWRPEGTIDKSFVPT